MASRPSNPSVKGSSDPPPPPPLLEPLGCGVGVGVAAPGVGVGPEVMAAMQALVPALAGAEVVALAGPTTAVAESE